MENPIRTSAHLARMEERRHSLRGAVRKIVPRDARLVCEIGCGHGHFLTAYARQNPTQLCLGVDIESERIARANRKREHAGLANLHFVRADARILLEVLPSDARLAAIYLLFPDPWPKKRHHKHRIVQPEFLQAVAARAERGARLFFRTDHQPYFEYVQKVLRDHANWNLEDSAEPWPFEHETVFQRRAPLHYSLTACVRTP